MVVFRGWGEGDLLSYSMGIGFQFCKMKTLLEVEADARCTAVSTRIPLNCAFKW